MLNIYMNIRLILQLLVIIILESRPIIDLPNGKIEGIIMKSLRNRSIYAYMSIPYAKQPIGDLRFKELEEADNWRGTLDAGQAPELCMQLPFAGNNIIGVEDCLYINIFTPLRPGNGHNINDSLLPVIAYIHGGAFYFLDSSRYGPRYFLDHDVLLVSFNYRLGALGFMSSGDEALPGNLGMKDQIFALKWIQRNIHYFGGNAKFVTLLGMSAGAASVHLHYTSPLSKNLFRSSVMIGGSAFTSWALQTNPRRKFLRIAQHVGCFSNTSQTLVNCMRNVPAEKLVASIPLLQSKYIKVPVAPLAPVIEEANENAFLVSDPFQKFISGDVLKIPTIFTFSDNEGIFPVGALVANSTLLKLINKFWISFCILFLELLDKVSESELNEICYNIRKFYCGNDVISLASINCLFKMTTDRFMVDVIRAIAATSITNPMVYAYLFCYRGSYSSSVSLTASDVNYGASHIDDLYYYLNTSSSQTSMESSFEDIRMINTLTAMIVKFAYSGKAEWPNQDWKPVEKMKKSDLFSGKLNFLQILSPRNARMVHGWNWSNSSFWNSLPICQPWAGRFPYSSSPTVLAKCHRMLYD